MPFTPFHFGPAACVSLPLQKRIDPTAFVLANVAVDIEPLLVLTFRLETPLHGLTHTYVGGAVVGLVFAALLHLLGAVLQPLVTKFGVTFHRDFKTLAGSAVAGVWFHVLLDSFLYSDIEPFFPLSLNPLEGLVSGPTMYLTCAFLYLPAAVLYGVSARRFKKQP